MVLNDPAEPRVLELQLPPRALELTRAPFRQSMMAARLPAADSSGAVRYPCVRQVERLLDRAARLLLIAQLLASAAPSAELEVPFQYNERYKHYERLDCIGHSFSFVTGA